MNFFTKKSVNNNDSLEHILVQLQSILSDRLKMVLGVNSVAPFYENQDKTLMIVYTSISQQEFSDIKSSLELVENYKYLLFSEVELNRFIKRNQFEIFQIISDSILYSGGLSLIHI